MEGPYEPYEEDIGLDDERSAEDSDEGEVFMYTGWLGNGVDVLRHPALSPPPVEPIAAMAAEPSAGAPIRTPEEDALLSDLEAHADATLAAIEASSDGFAEYQQGGPPGGANGHDDRAASPVEGWSTGGPLPAVSEQAKQSRQPAQQKSKKTKKRAAPQTLAERRAAVLGMRSAERSPVHLISNKLPDYSNVKGRTDSGGVVKGGKVYSPRRTSFLDASTSSSGPKLRSSQAKAVVEPPHAASRPNSSHGRSPSTRTHKSSSQRRGTYFGLYSTEQARELKVHPSPPPSRPKRSRSGGSHDTPRLQAPAGADTSMRNLAMSPTERIGKPLADYSKVSSRINMGTKKRKTPKHSTSARRGTFFGTYSEKQVADQKAAPEASKPIPEHQDYVSGEELRASIAQARKGVDLRELLQLSAAAKLGGAKDTSPETTPAAAEPVAVIDDSAPRMRRGKTKRRNQANSSQRRGTYFGLYTPEQAEVQRDHAVSKPVQHALDRSPPRSSATTRAPQNTGLNSKVPARSAQKSHNAKRTTSARRGTWFGTYPVKTTRCADAAEPASLEALAEHSDGSGSDSGDAVHAQDQSEAAMVELCAHAAGPSGSPAKPRHKPQPETNTSARRGTWFGTYKNTPPRDGDAFASPDRKGLRTLAEDGEGGSTDSDDLPDSPERHTVPWAADQP